MAISLKTSAQFGYKIVKDPKSDSEMLVGEISDLVIDSAGRYEWFNKGRSSYRYDSTSINKLKNICNPYNFVVFAGTWCEDTQNLLPQFYSVASATQIKSQQIKLFGVDRNKQALNIEKDLYKINFVPTFIVFKNNREVGRIVESVNKSIEKDLLLLIEADLLQNPEK